MQGGAIYELQSVGVHIGRHIDSGHWVSFTRDKDGWKGKNDERVDAVEKRRVRLVVPRLLY